jgi:hypothetical protein
LLDFKKNLNFPTLNISSYYDSIATFKGSNSKKIIPHAYLFDKTGNELVILMVHDAIRNFNTNSFSFVNNFSKDFIANHIFEKPEPVLYNDLLLYKINFELSTKVEIDNYDVKGAIYIQPENYAIYKFDYSCFYIKSMNEKKRLYSISTEYDYETETDSLMHLKYISFNNLFEISDPDTSSYFKVTNYYLNPDDLTNSTLTVEFNRTPEFYSASRKSNYTISIENEKIGIKEIIPFEQSVNIVLQERFTNTEEKKGILNVKNIRDLSGNLINERKTIEMHQFRELFVQDFNKKLQFIDYNYLKPVPLEQNSKSVFKDKFDYWMNTPEFNKAEK